MSLLEHNLSTLPADLASRIRNGPDDLVSVSDQARDGTPNLGTRVDGQVRMFHSRYAPLREAKRLVQAVTAPVVVVAGAGLGYHVAELLGQGRRVLVFEPSVTVLRHWLSTCNITESVEKGTLVIVTQTERIVYALTHWHIPMIHGDLEGIALRGRVAADEPTFREFWSSLHSAHEQLRADIGTQARFGLAWMRNLIVNLTRCALDSVPIAVPESLLRGDVVVVAAGPSLDSHLDWIRDHRSGLQVVSTDTALPACLAAGIEPQLVVAIDASPIGVRHFLHSGQHRPLLAAELSVPTALISRAGAVIPLASGNPLHQTLVHRGVPLLSAPIDSGNVTVASVLLAQIHGARSVTLAGADFAYPFRRTYARNTYVERFFDELQTRIKAADSLNLDFLYARSGLRALEGNPHTMTTPVLDHYRSMLVHSVRSGNVPVYALEGSGARLPFERPPAPRSTPFEGPLETEEPISPATVREAFRDLYSSLDRIHGASEIRRAAEGLASDAVVGAARSLLPIAYAIGAREPMNSSDRSLEEARIRLSQRLRSAMDSPR